MVTYLNVRGMEVAAWFQKLAVVGILLVGIMLFVGALLFDPNAGASDGHFIVACGNDGQFIKLCQALGQFWHDDERFATNPNRVTHREHLVPLMQAVFDTQTRSHWLSLLEQHGVPCGSINSIDEALNLPQTHDRQMVVSFNDGPIKVLGNPIKLSATPATYTRPPPTLGQDNDDILAQLALA
ncbi:MAG: CoA transferase [Moraxella equi]|nr:CoA transferase [Moraxella equi]